MRTHPNTHPSRSHASSLTQRQLGLKLEREHALEKRGLLAANEELKMVNETLESLVKAER